MTTRTVVHLLRHGEVDNPRGVLYGRLPDFHLSELGRRMAQVVADHLASHDITVLVASPLERAQETAAPLAAALDLPIGTDERLVEAANRFEGERFDARAFTRPSTWLRLVDPFTPSWGEPYEEIATRMQAAIADAREAAAGHEAVLVSHQLPVWTARRRAEGKRLWHDPRSRECTLASLTSLEYGDDQLRAVTYSEPAAALLPRAATTAGA